MVLYMSAALVKVLDMNVGLEKEVEHLSESSVSCLPCTSHGMGVSCVVCADPSLGGQEGREPAEHVSIAAAMC